MLVVSITGQRAVDAPAEEEALKKDEVLTPAGVPADEEVREDQPEE